MNKIDFGNLLHAAPDHYAILGWIVLLPLLGAIINGVWGKSLGRQGVYIAGITSVAASFALSLLAFVALLKANQHAPGAAEGAEGAGHAVQRALSFIPEWSGKRWDWFLAPTGPNTAEMIHVRYVLDPLSGVMLLVVTGVGTLIHVYSAGYMSHDPSYARFFAYLNLFIFAMLNLILGDSMVLMFLGWEGVGLASYLLIGFWFTNNAYASAGRKAFIVNRIGDAGCILGMAILAWKGGSYQFETLRDHVYNNAAFWEALAEHTHLGEFLADLLPNVSAFAPLARKLQGLDCTWGGLACFLLFVGCCGKSAQIPLYVWLPDAMAGPTPVSALIHAATMVTAGIYLLCRMSFLFVYFTSVMNLIAVVGAATALFAATIAVTQVELKKVLAYSTVSQLGFMFLGCGVGAFSAGFFHVFTHAFFKACLFLGAGAVMHACRDKQDIRELGGLRKYLPGTHLTFLVATAAIIGTPLTSGFFSKDEILFRAFAQPSGVGKVVYFMGVAAATLTSFYMCRLFILTFLGDGPKYLDAAPAHGHDHGHGHDDHGHGDPNAPPSEAGTDMKLMTYPLYVLAALALLAGPLGLPHAWTHQEGILPRFLEHSVADSMRLYSAEVVTAMHAKETVAMIGGLAAWIVGMGAAYWVYVMQRGEPADKAAEALPGVYRLMVDKWRVDELYNATVVALTRGLAAFAAVFDRFIIDGLLVNGAGKLAVLFGRAIKPLQTGVVQVYGAFIGIGTLALVGWMVFLPNAAISTRMDGNTAVLEANGGPGYSYRWAFFDPTNVGNTLAERCPKAQSLQALTQAGNPTTMTRRSEPVSAARCAVLEAKNAFGRTTYAYTYLSPQQAGGTNVQIP